MPAPRPLEFRRRAVELARPQNKPIARTARNLGSPASCLHNWMARARRRRGLVRELAALVMTRPAIAVSVIRAAATGLPASGTKMIQRSCAGQEGTAADRAFPEQWHDGRIPRWARAVRLPARRARAWPGSAASSSGCAWDWRCGTGAVPLLAQQDRRHRVSPGLMRSEAGPAPDPPVGACRAAGRIQIPRPPAGPATLLC